MLRSTDSRGRVRRSPSPTVWFAGRVMAVSRAICTGARAPVTFARGRAAIKETGGGAALQTRCQEQQRSRPPPARPDHRRDGEGMGRGGGLTAPVSTHALRSLEMLRGGKSQS